MPRGNERLLTDGRSPGVKRLGDAGGKGGSHDCRQMFHQRQSDLEIDSLGRSLPLRAIRANRALRFVENQWGLALLAQNTKLTVADGVCWRRLDEAEVKQATWKLYRMPTSRDGVQPLPNTASRREDSREQVGNRRSASDVHGCEDLHTGMEYNRSPIYERIFKSLLPQLIVNESQYHYPRQRKAVKGHKPLPRRFFCEKPTT